MLQTQATHALKPQGQFYDLPQVKFKGSMFQEYDNSMIHKTLATHLCSRAQFHEAGLGLQKILCHTSLAVVCGDNSL